MSNLLLVRHPEAYTGPASPTGASSYGLTDRGRKQALAVGEWLHGLGEDGVPLLIERAASERSKKAALIIAGQITHGTPQVVQREEFTHATYALTEVVDRMGAWLVDVAKRESGLYVACMSRRAILAAIGPVLGMSTEEIEQALQDNDPEVPLASVTRLNLTRHGKASVDYIGQLPEELAAA